MTDTVANNDGRMFVTGEIVDRLQTAGFNSADGVMWADDCHVEYTESQGGFTLSIELPTGKAATIVALDNEPFIAKMVDRTAEALGFKIKKAAPAKKRG